MNPTRLTNVIALMAASFVLLSDAQASLVLSIGAADANDTISSAELATHHSAITDNLLDSADFGTFTDPGTGVGLTGDKVATTINGDNYGFRVHEHAYTGGGVFVDLVAARTANFNGTNYLFSNESPASQGGADAYGWGYDTISTGSPNSSNSAQQSFLFDFSISPTDVGTFSFSLLDFGSGTDLSAYVGVWDESGGFVQSWEVDYGGSPYGDGEAHQAFIQSDGDAIGYVALIVGDNDDPSNFSEQLAIGDLYVGGFAAVPEPGAALPLAGLLVAVLFLHRRRRSFGGVSPA